MPNDREIYSIYAIRLENFHNINHVIIPISEGGHLFLLGDNGSGKTTILDAVHYVLSAGEQIELNSAARFGGNKQDGRRINGVVTRINVDTGPMCPDGRVTYAALELRNGVGNSVCIGIGLSISSANSPLQQWGFKMNCAIESLPLLIKSSEGEEYPADREELKKILKKSDGHYYSTMTLFAQAIARDFFSGDSQYEEYRKFLNMCKAYREISSRAGNYHELFKSLLPEPEREVLRDLRLSLKDLRETSSTLNSLEKRCSYLQSLYDDKIHIDHLIAELSILNLGILWLDKENWQKQLDHATEQLNLLTEACDQKAREQEQAESNLQKLNSILTDLKNRDSSSLIDSEKRRSQELKQLEDKQAKLQIKIEQSEQQQLHLQEKNRITSENFKNILTNTATLLLQNIAVLRNLPLKPVQDSIQETLMNNQAYRALSLNDFSDFQRKVALEVAHSKVRLEEANKYFERTRQELIEAETEIDKLKNLKETTPESLPDYADWLDEIDQNMLYVTPLYLKLHWQKDIPNFERSAIEELIGEPVLATLVTDSNYEAKLQELLIRNHYYGARCAVLDEENNAKISPRIFEFLKHYFDTDRDTKYLEVLAREFDSTTIPEFSENTPIDFAKWRGSFRVLCDSEAKLIGEEEREAEKKRRIAEATEIWQSKKLLHDQAQSKLKSNEQGHKTLVNFETHYGKLLTNITNEKNELINLEQQMLNLQENLTENLRLKDEYEQQLNEVKQIVLKLRAQIQSQNLQSLNAQINEINEQCLEAQQKYQQIHDDFTRHLCQQESQSQKCDNLSNELTEAINELNSGLAISSECENEEMLKKYLSDYQIVNKKVCQEAITLKNAKKSEIRGKINERINSNEGIDYGFTYDQEGNELYSREHRTLQMELSTLKGEVEKQKEILDENMRRNFEKILLEDFRKSIRNRIYSLEDMHNKINRMLKGHLFGRNTYSLKIDPLSEYAPLVRVMKSFSEQTPESAEELKSIFDAHSVDILDTPANHVPEILDYRNYFTYKMLLHAPGANSRIMDSRTKSVGSGGEQAVPNYLLVMMIAHLLFDKSKGGTGAHIKINTILFDEAFYGIDQQRQDQLLSFAEELGLQLVIASPNQDGFKIELANSTNVFVRKDKNYDVHLINYNWHRDQSLFAKDNELSWGQEI